MLVGLSHIILYQFTLHHNDSCLHSQVTMMKEGVQEYGILDDQQSLPASDMEQAVRDTMSASIGIQTVSRFDYSHCRLHVLTV